jgi:hypothetical protein
VTSTRCRIPCGGADVTDGACNAIAVGVGEDVTCVDDGSVGVAAGAGPAQAARTSANSASQQAEADRAVMTRDAGQGPR